MSTYDLVRLTPWVVGVFAVLGFAATVRWPGTPRCVAWLGGPVGPLLAACVAAGAMLFVTEGKAPMPVISDEASYRLQAELFASGRWSAPSPSRPEFFEQMHVLMVPTVASKYFPGHALLLAPGIAVGWPWLIPLLLNALAGALVFLLARRHFGVGVAVLALALWVASEGNLRWRASWYSEVSSSALLLGAWCLAGMTGRRGTIAGTVVLVAAMALTRPLTAIATAVPVGVVLLLRSTREARRAELAGGVAIGLLLLGILPIWSHATTGSWRETPQARYTRDYMPWDKIGFGLDTTLARRALPADHRIVGEGFQDLHAAHSPVTMVPTLASRALEAIRHAASGWRTDVALLGLLGVVTGGWPIAVALGTVALQFLLYGFYAHPPGWTLYYLELFPVLAMLVAAGFGVIARQVVNRMRGSADHVRWLLIFALGVAIGSYPDLRIQRGQRQHRDGPLMRFTSRLATLPGRALVFVRYGPEHSPHRALITNLVPLASQRVIVAYDRGAENQLLRLHYPDRSAYLYEEATGTLRELTGPDTAAGSARAPAGP